MQFGATTQVVDHQVVALRVVEVLSMVADIVVAEAVAAVAAVAAAVAAALKVLVLVQD